MGADRGDAVTICKSDNLYTLARYLYDSVLGSAGFQKGVEMEFVTNTVLRKHLGRYLSKVHFGGKRYLIYRHGQEMAALVSVRDLARIEEFERKSARQKDLEYQIRSEAWERAKRGEPGTVIR